MRCYGSPSESDGADAWMPRNREDDGAAVPKAAYNNEISRKL